MPLDLENNENRKLFQEICKGLKDKDIFTGAKQEYGNFVKLIEIDINKTRTIEALEIYTEWDTVGGSDKARKNPIEGEIGIFTSSKASTEDI